MDINRIVEELEKGNLVITPTDTVYGILAKSSDDRVVNKVFEAKQRALNKSLIVLVNGIDMLKRVVKEITPLQQELINKYWPGKLTIIFDKNDTISDLEILGRVNEPLISTSANISNNDTIVSIDMLDDELKIYISYIEDGGIVKASSSTIVWIEDNHVKILRDGDLSEDIKKNFID